MKLAILLFTLFLPLSSYANYKVYYLPMSANSMVPVKPEDIESMAQFTYEAPSKTFRDLFQAARTQPSKMTAKMNIRAKIVDMKSGKFLFLNKDKGFYDGKYRVRAKAGLAKEAFGEIEAKVREICQDPGRTEDDKEHCGSVK